MKKKMRKKKNLVQNLDGLLPIGWARHRARRRGAAGGLARCWAAGVRCWACWGAQGVRVRVDGCAGCVARSGRVGGKELGAGARAEGERQRR